MQVEDNLRGLPSHNRKYPHYWFDFLHTQKHEDGLIEAWAVCFLKHRGRLGGKGFANTMKKKRKRKQGG